MNPDPVLAARDAFLYLGALGLFAIVAVFLHYSRRVNDDTAQPEPQRPDRCDICGLYDAVQDRTIASTHTPVTVCVGCDHEGQAKNRWVKTVATFKESA